MEEINAKLRARNLEVEAELASKMAALNLTSKGVQCDVTDVASADAEVVHLPSRRDGQSCSTDGVLEAAWQNDLAHLRAILQTYPPEEVNVTTKDEGKSALHLAASAGHTEVARLLLGSEKFTAVNSHTSAKQHFLRIALHEAVAAAAGHEGVVSLLLGSARFVAASARSSNGSTALHDAVWYGTCKSCKASVAVASL